MTANQTKTPTAAPAVALDHQSILKRQRENARRALLKRRQRKSHQ